MRLYHLLDIVASAILHLAPTSWFSNTRTHGNEIQGTGPFESLRPPVEEAPPAREVDGGSQPQLKGKGVPSWGCISFPQSSGPAQGKALPPSRPSCGSPLLGISVCHRTSSWGAGLEI